MIFLPMEKLDFVLQDFSAFESDLSDATCLLIPKDSQFQNELIMDINPQEFIEFIEMWQEVMQYIDFKMTIVVDKSDYIQS